MSNRLLNKLITGLFLFFLISPFIGRLMGINSRTDNTEYRRLLKAPIIKDAPFSLLPKNLTDYFNDDFGFRNIFIKIYGTIKLNIFNTHPLYSIILGKQGWIFMNPVVFPTIHKWHLYADFTDDQLISIANYLQSENDWLSNRGIKYIVVIVPNKEDVYSEMYPFPNYIVTKPILEHFLSYMKQNTSVEILDLRNSLIQAKSVYPVYYHTDTHWTNWGAYIAYQEIGKILSRNNQDFHLFNSNEFDITPEVYQHWVGDMMRTSAVWKDKVPDVGVKLKLKPDLVDKYQKLDSIFVYGDSFAESQHFADRDDFLEEFPELKDRLDLIFAHPTDSKALRIKAQIDDLIPVIEKNISDPHLAKRVERYLINFRLLDDESIGINYFLNFNFSNIHFEQRQHPLEKEAIENKHPQAVIREVIQQVLYSTFETLVPLK